MAMAAFAGNTTIISKNFPSPLPNLQSYLHQPYFTNLRSTPNMPISSSSSPPTTRISDPSSAIPSSKYLLLHNHKPISIKVGIYRPNSFSDPAWSEFARNVSGEWDGHGADFTVGGNPIELPENVVPEAYKEWEVKVFDWQTQCPTLADPDEHSLMYKAIKLLPTVACEADSPTRYTVDEKRTSNGVLGFGYQSNGSYVAVWPVPHLGVEKLELEHCLVNPGDIEARVRVVQVVDVDGGKIVLEGVRVYREHRYGPFRNGDQLGGCAIKDAAFASTSAMDASEVVGSWQGIAAVASFDGLINFKEVSDASKCKLVRGANDLIFLPKQLWCSLKERENGETCSEVGWLLEHGCANTSRCIFSDTATMKEVSFSRENTALEGV